MTCKDFEFFIGRFRKAERHEFDFVELVLPDQTARVLSIRPGFPPKAG